MSSESEIQKRLAAWREILGRPIRPAVLQPRLDEEQLRFEGAIRAGVTEVFETKEGKKEIAFTLEPDRKNRPQGRKRILIRNPKTERIIGAVSLHGSSLPSQHEVDLNIHLNPPNRGVGILERGVELYDQHLHNQGVIVTNIPDDGLSKSQF